jgi:type II secretory pathway pseudopilin PulG
MSARWPTHVTAEGGVSLVEATVIIAVLATLTAIMAPTIGDYVNDAKQVRAAEDVKIIGSALQRMLRDTGETMVLANGASTASGFGPSHAASNRVTMIVSDGTAPTAAVARAGLTNWDSSNGSPAAAVVTTIAAQLTTNTANFDPTSGATYNSSYAWRGAYLPQNPGPDPWGRRYAVNTEFLGRISSSTSGAPNQTDADNDAFVISAGPNGIVDTAFAAAATSVSGDDVLYVISGGAPQ